METKEKIPYPDRGVALRRGYCNEGSWEIIRNYDTGLFAAFFTYTDGDISAITGSKFGECEKFIDDIVFSFLN